MICCTGKGHDKNYRQVTGKPVGIHLRKNFTQHSGKKTVGSIAEQITIGKNHAPEHHGNLVNHAQETGTGNIKIFRYKHHKYSKDIRCYHYGKGQQKTVLQSFHRSRGGKNFFNSPDGKFPVREKSMINDINIRINQKCNNKPYKKDTYHGKI